MNLNPKNHKFLKIPKMHLTQMYLKMLKNQLNQMYLKMLTRLKYH